MEKKGPRPSWTERGVIFWLDFAKNICKLSVIILCIGQRVSLDETPGFLSPRRASRR
jgi:hypothetical protein